MSYPWYVIHCEAHHDRQVYHAVSPNSTFADLDGLFCETFSGEHRISVLIDMMRRQARVELDVLDAAPKHQVDSEPPLRVAEQQVPSRSSRSCVGGAANESRG